jgi:hypothetical protein
MFEAARVGDDIGHSGALAGMIAGTIVGGLIAAAGGILAGAMFIAGLGASCLAWASCSSAPAWPWGITPGSWRPPPGQHRGRRGIQHDEERRHHLRLAQCVYQR